MKKTVSFAFSLLLGLLAGSALIAHPAAAQSAALHDDKERPRVVNAEGHKEAATFSADDATIQNHIQSVYQNFLNTYRLGAGDVLGIFVDKHPDDSVPRAVISPVGQIYYPLMGNITVVGKTLPQLQEFFTTSISEFIKEPRVTVSLLEANSAKIGVLGDVKNPGVVVLSKPMRVLDALAAVGGITDTGNSSKVSVLRQFEDGRTQVVTVNVKKILQGRAGPEENLAIRAGDMVVVPGNTFKTLSKIASIVGLTSFVTLISRGQ